MQTKSNSKFLIKNNEYYKLNVYVANGRNKY